MKLPQELKDAISQLPSKEKDKLIFRLIKRDVDLANRLLFELVSTDTVSQRREEMRKRLKADIHRATEHFYSPGYLNMDVRSMSGNISEHVRTTKDKIGEITLNLFIMNEILEKNNDKILKFPYGKAYTFSIAVMARAFKIMLLIKKQHEDYMVEYEEDIKRFGNLIGQSPHLMNAAIHNGLDVNWLIRAEIPDDIAEIYKDIRKRGYLR